MPNYRRTRAKTTEEWEEFVEDCDSTLAVLEELPDRAEDFREQKAEFVESMKSWAEENEHVTEKMKNALADVDEKASKWVSW